jgi:hypothetical protein
MYVLWNAGGISVIYNLYVVFPLVVNESNRYCPTIL